LRVFVTVLLAIAAANGIVAYVQFNLTPDQMAAWGPGYADLVRGQGGFEGAGRNFVDEAGTARVRPFGLGGDAGSGGVLGALAVAGAIALLSSRRRPRQQILVAALAAGVATAVVTSQGRGVILFALTSVIAYVVLAATSRRRPSSLVGLAVAGAICALTVATIVRKEGADAFRYDSLAVSQILQTSTERPTPAALQHAISEFPLGAGLAVAGPASGSAGASQYTGTLNAESTYSFLVLETGLPGAVLLVGFTLTLLFLGASRCRLEPDPEARALLAAIIAPVAGLLGLFYGGVVTSSTPTAPYLWFAGGIVSYWLVTRQQELRHGR
jgi:O-antigen ligase